MEENLANRSRAELETALRDSSRVLQAMLATQLRSFDDHFQHLLNDSERTLQGTFPGAFGELYTQNTKAFRDLYAELRLYYRGANLHLEETLAEFWARLLERLFKQLHPSCCCLMTTWTAWASRPRHCGPSGRPQESCACGPPAPSWLLAPSCKAWVWPVTWSARWLRSLWARSARGLS